MYPLGIVYAVVILGVQSTPPTVLVGALLLVISGAWMAFSVAAAPPPRRWASKPSLGCNNPTFPDRSASKTTVLAEGPATPAGGEIPRVEWVLGAIMYPKS